MSWWSCIFQDPEKGERPGGLKLTERGAAVCGFARDMRILDVAAGGGCTVSWLRNKLGCRAEGVDLCPGEGSPVRFGDAHDLPCEDGAYDGCLMECVLSQLSDPDKALRECARVLLPGGRMFLSGLYARSGPGYEDSPLGRLDTRETLYRRMEDAGFRMILFEDHTTELIYALAEAVFTGKAEDLKQKMEEDPAFRSRDCGYYLMAAEKKNDETAAVIAAAGLSSRMGDFKQLMKLGEYGFVEHIIRSFQAAGIQRIAVITGHRAEEVEDSLRRYGVEFLRNPQYAATEMLDSAKIGFRHFQGVKKLLFCPSDIPLFRPETVRRLLRQPLPEDLRAVVLPEYQGTAGHPVLIGGGLLPELISAGPEGGLRKALQDTGAEQILVSSDDPGMLFDADTKEEYQRLCSIIDSADRTH